MSPKPCHTAFGCRTQQFGSVLSVTGSTSWNGTVAAPTCTVGGCQQVKNQSSLLSISLCMRERTWRKLMASSIDSLVRICPLGASIIAELTSQDAMIA
ncbi:hypothetical protein D3C78_1040950 [compost metagenome]